MDRSPRSHTMDDARRPRRSPPSVAAAVPLLLLLAVSSGSYAAAADAGAPAGKTELQRHVAFFDRDEDGVISLSELEEGLRAVGLGAAMAKANAAFIMSFVGPKTRPVQGNATTSRSIYVENIHKGKYRSDTGVYDYQGRFVSAKFDEIFSKYAKTAPDALTEKELDEMRYANRAQGDSKGWNVSRLEWGTLYKIAKDKDGFLRRDTVRGLYDGSLFYKLAKK